MAFAAQLEGLTDELIEVLTHVKDQGRSNEFRRHSLHSLQHHTFLRTNQFEIENHLDGIEERFRILNKDSLADALSSRRDNLPGSNFTPDILHFLLELSDKPLANSKLADLDALRESLQDPGEQLTWEDIAGEDGWDDDVDLWKNVDFADNSSDEADEASKSDNSSETNISSVESQHRRGPHEFIVNTADETALDKIQKTQLWRKEKVATENTQKAVISECQMIREVLFMLHGLDNDLFDRDCQPLGTCTLQHATWEACNASLELFGELGRHLKTLRDFAKLSHQIPLMQVFREAVEKRLAGFDVVICKIENRFVSVKENLVVSLPRLLHEIRPHLEQLEPISLIIRQLERERYPHPFRYLELLYDSASIAQTEGNETTYETLAILLFHCFRVYIRPIRRWMEEGELFDGDKTFFISDSQVRVPPTQLWHGRFKLRRTPDGALHAPKFLRPAAAKIFTTGKSVVILKQLGKHSPLEKRLPEPSLDFHKFIDDELDRRFIPFSETFSLAFEKWMQSKHHTASATLRQVLFEECNLWSTLETLEQIYLMSDGYKSEMFAHALFSNLDILNQKWHDRFVLTEMAIDAFATATSSHHLSITASGPDIHEDLGVARRMVRKCLPALKISVRIHWLLRIVISDESIEHYQAVFTFLLQLRRARHALQKYRILSGATKENFHSSDPESAAIYHKLRWRLQWFLNALQSYLSNLVLAPLTQTLHADLDASPDVDAMAAVHATFAKRIRDATCLGARLKPIHTGMLEIFDLSLRLEDARQLASEREAEETQELSRLSILTTSSSSNPSRVERYVEAGEEEDATFLEDQRRVGGSTIPRDADKTYEEVLRDVGTQFERQLRFVASGLRGVARASGDAAATRWDTLAEMLEAGIDQDETLGGLM